MKFNEFKTEIISIIVLIGLVFTGYFWFADTLLLYAKNERVDKLEYGLVYQQKEYQRDTVQERIWKIIDRYECDTEDVRTCKKIMPETVKEELRNLIRKKETLEKELEKLERLTTLSE